MDTGALPITLSEALAGGLTWRQLQSGSWQRLCCGVYARSSVRRTPWLTLKAVSRRLPPGAAFSGRTAGWLYGLQLAWDSPIEVTAPADVSASRRAGVTYHRAMLAREEVCEYSGLPVTTPLRTAIDLGSGPDLYDSVVALDMAVHQELVGLPTLKLAARIGGRRKGYARLRRAVELVDGGSESPMETRLRVLLELNGLPRPEVQAELRDSNGLFIARADLFYRSSGLVIEYDGATHRDSLVQDNRRQNRLIQAGYRILRFTAADLSDPLRAVATIRGLLTSTPASRRDISAEIAGRVGRRQGISAEMSP